MPPKEARMIHIFTSPKTALLSFFNSTYKNPSFCARLCHGRLHGPHSCLSMGFDSRRRSEIYKCQDSGEEGSAHSDSKIYVVGSQGQKCAYDCLISPPFPFYSPSIPPQFLPSVLVLPFAPSPLLCPAMKEESLVFLRDYSTIIFALPLPSIVLSDSFIFFLSKLFAS